MLEEFLLDAIISEIKKPETLKEIVRNILETQKELSNKNLAVENLINTKKQAKKNT